MLLLLHIREYIVFGRVGAGAGPFKLFFCNILLLSADAVCISLPPKKDWYGDWFLSQYFSQAAILWPLLFHVFSSAQFRHVPKHFRPFFPKYFKFQSKRGLKTCVIESISETVIGTIGTNSCVFNLQNLRILFVPIEAFSLRPLRQIIGYWSYKVWKQVVPHRRKRVWDILDWLYDFGRRRDSWIDNLHLCSSICPKEMIFPLHSDDSVIGSREIIFTATNCNSQDDDRAFIFIALSIKLMHC